MTNSNLVAIYPFSICSLQSDVDDDASWFRAAVLPPRDVRTSREEEDPQEVLPKHDDRWISQVGAIILSSLFSLCE